MSLVHLHTADFAAAVEAAPLAMVDFWAEWCGPCKMLGPTMEELARQYDGKVLVAKVNVDEEPQLAAQFGVMSIPTLIIFKNGEIVQKAVGLQDEASVEQLLK